MAEQIKERPQLIAEAGNEAQEQVYKQFTKNALQRALETQQTLADIEAGNAPFEGNQDIAANLENIFAVTDNGKRLDFDVGTWTQALTDKAHESAVAKFQSSRDEQEREKLRRNVAVHALGVYATRVNQYKRQAKPGRKGNAA